MASRSQGIYGIRASCQTMSPAPLISQPFERLPFSWVLRRGFNMVAPLIRMRVSINRAVLRLLIVLTVTTGLLSDGAAEKGAGIGPRAGVFTNSVGMAFIYVPPGTFEMGSPPDELGRDLDETLHKITLTKGFYLQNTEVTQAQWKGVMGGNPSMLKNDDLPVTNVSWDDALAFIRTLNQLEGTDTYRLPSEAEWEYACRAGVQTPFPTGLFLSTDQANYDGNYPYDGYEKGVFRRTTVRVDKFLPNKWGFYDMSGNVSEWCQDYYGPYSSKPEINPGGASSGLFRVLRGGSWYYDIQSCRCASRHKADPSNQSIVIGFRVAKSLR